MAFQTEPILVLTGGPLHTLDLQKTPNKPTFACTPFIFLASELLP